MSLRVTVCSEVKALKRRSRRETESDKGVRHSSGVASNRDQLHVVDPKPGDLIMARLKLR